RDGSLGLLTTHAADSLTTDSAAAATALAAGCKANIGAVGVCADGHTSKTVMERAREKGMRAALVTTSTVYDASPAAFLSHLSNRKDFESILDQYLRAAPDLILGGGREQFLPAGRPESARKGGKDRLAEFTARGYAYASDKAGLTKASGAKLLGLFTPGEMNFDLDRDVNKEPSLVEMTRAAIRFLGRDDRGVALAYEFYVIHRRETLILVTSDHDSGGVGFTLALQDLRPDAKRVAANEEDLKKIASIPISLRKAAALLGPRPTAEAVDRMMHDVFKGFRLAPDLKKMLLAAQ